MVRRQTRRSLRVNLARSSRDAELAGADPDRVQDDRGDDQQHEHHRHEHADVAKVALDIVVFEVRLLAQP